MTQSNDELQFLEQQIQSILATGAPAESANVGGPAANKPGRRVENPAPPEPAESSRESRAAPAIVRDEGLQQGAVAAGLLSEGAIAAAGQSASAVAATAPAECSPPPTVSENPTPAVLAVASGHKSANSTSQEPGPPEFDCDLGASQFMPVAPQAMSEVGLPEREVEAIVLKLLLNCGASSGREVNEHVRLPFPIINTLMARLKQERLSVYRAEAGPGDYVHELTDLGCERARRHAGQCTYFGAIPVSLEDYIAGVEAQSVAHQKPRRADLVNAFSDLTLSDEMFSRLGQALHAGRALFLSGPPGNGKTSIAERVTRAWGHTLWIPRCVSVHGEIIRLFDPTNHEEVEDVEVRGAFSTRAFDQRWVHIQRPTIVVGGELTMDKLDLTLNRDTGINEASIQLKANGGTLVVDDFGRQRMSTDELLNRWIVPLEKGYDFLNMASGRKIQAPFDQMVIFSTNLEPRDLVDEAFLRRIPYKIEVTNPTETQFRAVFESMARNCGLELSAELVDYLVEEHFLAVGRPMRFCQPRDILRQIENFCGFHELPPRVTREAIDAAVQNYFAVM